MVNLDIVLLRMSLNGEDMKLISLLLEKFRQGW